MGWTAAKLNAVLRHGEGNLTQSKWKNGVSVGVGYDRILSDNMRVGLGYTATFFGKTRWNNWSIGGKDMKSMSDADKDRLNKMFGLNVGRMVNHTVSVGVTYVVPSGS